MPRLLAAGHVTWDRTTQGEVLGGTASYAALSAFKLGWDAAVLTAAGPDFEPARDLPGLPVFVQPGTRTTRFQNTYSSGGARRQVVTARSEPIDLSVLPESWRRPDALLLGPVVGEVPPRLAMAFEAEVVGAVGQGWLRHVERDGEVSVASWVDPAADLAGVHVLFLSEHDLHGTALTAHDLLRFVPMLALTRGFEGLRLLTRHAIHEVPGLPRPEVDPTGAGDVLAAAFLVRYFETGDPLAAAAFGACAASCCVEGVGAKTLGTRAEVERRLALRERLIEGGEWEE
jgi:1D-myo-inositol 3-kinase